MKTKLVIPNSQEIKIILIPENDYEKGIFKIIEYKDIDTSLKVNCFKGHEGKIKNYLYPCIEYDKDDIESLTIGLRDKM